MAMVTEVVCLWRLAAFVVVFTSCAGSTDIDIDYCQKEQDRCDDYDGIYKGSHIKIDAQI